MASFFDVFPNASDITNTGWDTGVTSEGRLVVDCCEAIVFDVDKAPTPSGYNRVNRSLFLIANQYHRDMAVIRYSLGEDGDREDALLRAVKQARYLGFDGFSAYENMEDLLHENEVSSYSSSSYTEGAMMMGGCRPPISQIQKVSELRDKDGTMWLMALVLNGDTRVLYIDNGVGEAEATKSLCSDLSHVFDMKNSKKCIIVR